MVKKVKTEEYDGEDRRIDVTKLEFGLGTVLKIIFVVAVFVSTAVVYQLQIQNNTKTLENLTTIIDANSGDIETLKQTVDDNVDDFEDLKDDIKTIQRKKMNVKEFETFKEWVEEEI